jgi:dTDP-glucose 4,6-dehydratase
MAANKIKILVTGGAGFIGSNFIRYIQKTYPDYQITNFDKLTYAGNPDNLIGVEDCPRYTFIKGDLVDAKQVRRAVEGIDFIVHFAAESHVDRSIVQPEDFIATNVTGTYHLLESAKKAGVRKFVHVSTDEVYGTLDKGCFTEQSPLRPNSPYSASKAGSDLLVRSYVRTYGFPAVITRCSNNYGPYQFPEKLIPLMTTSALAGESLPVYGDGRNVRDWIFVEDHCRAVDTVLHQGKTGEIYNIGGNNEWINLDVVKLILRHLERSETLIEFVEDRLGHDRRYALDCSKIHRELGWSPRVRFEDGIVQTINWYQRNTEWVRRIKSGEYRKSPPELPVS